MVEGKYFNNEKVFLENYDDKCGETRKDDNFVKGRADWRKYRYLEMENNGVGVMLVEDKESVTTGVSCCVNVGAASDVIPGLAHLTEHMCFLGSEKYPEENEFKKLLSCHGGRSNASTSMHTTTFQFEILADHIAPSLERFAHFFQSLTLTSIPREIKAVDSENSKNQTSDGRRRLQILKDIAHPDHYYAKFTTGNLTTLQDKDPITHQNNISTEEAKESSIHSTIPVDENQRTKELQQLVRAFHDYHYRTQPQNLTLVIVGPQSLDTLEELANSTFGMIPSSDLYTAENKVDEKSKTYNTLLERVKQAASKAPKFGYRDNDGKVYNSAFMEEGSNKSLIVTIPPILTSKRHLALIFPIPPTINNEKDSLLTVSMLGHLLGHEGPGSSFAILQKKGWIHSLTAGQRLDGPDQGLFQVRVSLTEQGENNWKDVADILFAHCRILATTPTLWEELSQLHQMKFHTNSPGSPYFYAPYLAQQILTYGPQQCLHAGLLLTGDDSQQHFVDEATSRIREYAQTYLLPQNSIIERCSTTFWDQVSADEPNKKVEPHYSIEYHKTPIPSDLLQQWQTLKKDSKNNNNNNNNDINVAIESLHLPAPNRYLPENLDLCPDLPLEATLGPRIDKVIDPPNIILNDPQIGRLWHRLDDRYALPKSSLTLTIINPTASYEFFKDENKWKYSVENTLKTTMLTSIFNQAMAQETYDADLAGLKWSISSTGKGLSLVCHGFSNKLSHFATTLLQKFVSSSDFCTKSYFNTTKDQAMRRYQTFLQSNRADTYATYYRDIILSNQYDGIPEFIDMLPQITLESVKQHHDEFFLVQPKIECFFTGNVSQSEAKSFFKESSSILSQKTQDNLDDDKKSSIPWSSGFYERLLQPGKDIDIHFQSENSHEENGAIEITYQSRKEGFKGDGLSSKDSLVHSASMRLLCYILRVPFFDELRTKQQLGYIVSSYYDVGYSSSPHPPPLTKEGLAENLDYLAPWTVPVEYIVVKVLSKTQDPPTVISRIDEFMENFRDTLIKMPESEIRDYADSLSKKLTKPIQNLSQEKSSHLGKIVKYGPEVLANSGQSKDLPWNSSASLADTLQSIQRSDLLEVWDEVVMNKKERSRIVSCVYGKKFPLPKNLNGGLLKNQSSVVINDFNSLLSIRSKLKQFTNKNQESVSTRYFAVAELARKYKANKTTLGVAAAMMMGVGVVIGCSMTRKQKKCI